MPTQKTRSTRGQKDFTYYTSDAKEHRVKFVHTEENNVNNEQNATANYVCFVMPKCRSCRQRNEFVNILNTTKHAYEQITRRASLFANSRSRKLTYSASQHLADKVVHRRDVE